MFAVLQIPRLPLQAVLRMGSGGMACGSIGDCAGEGSAGDERGAATDSNRGRKSRVEASLYGGAPLAVVDGREKKPVVLEATEAAAREGVVVGLSIPQALARCESLAVRYRSEQAERMVEELLFASAYTLSPRVEADVPGEALVDLRGVKLGDALERCERIVGELASMGFRLGVGVAESWVVASLAASEAEGRVLVVGGNREGKEGALSATTERSELDRFLKALPLSKVAMGEGLRDVLEKWGIRTVGAFAALRRSAVGARLGAEGLRLWDRVTGREERVVTVAEPPSDFVESWEFEYDIDSVEPLLFLLRRFLDTLGVRMRAGHKVASGMRVELGLAYGDPLAVTQTMPEPTRDAEALFRLMSGRLESLETESPVKRLELTLEVTDFRDRQLGLFESSLKNPYRFTQTLSKVAGILGAERVGRPVLPEDGRPDGARLEALPASVPPLKELSLESEYGMPLRRFRPRLRASVEFQGRQPIWFQSAAVSGFVKAARGPWLRSGHWWEAEGNWNRVEWDVELNKGGVYRISKDEEGWTVEGSY